MKSALPPYSALQRALLDALLIGYYDASERLIFAGKVGTGRGFTAAFTSKLRAELAALEQRECPFTPEPPPAAPIRGHTRSGASELESLAAEVYAKGAIFLTPR